MLPDHQPLIPPVLTPRETQVLTLLMTGKTNCEIAKELFIADSTVKVYVASIFLKFGVSTRTEAAIVGWQAFPRLRRQSGRVVLTT